NRLPNDEEIAKKLRLSQEKVDQINFWLSTSTSSLDAPIGEEGESQVADLLEDKASAAPDAGISRIMDKEHVKNLLGIMVERERKVLDMRFGLADGKIHTLAEVSKKLGVSRERVRQIEEEALKKIRKFAEEQEKKT
ncbi:MAG: RNA polymerase sigma factor RpoD, partial [Candidatus Omnitrophica bacterium]|nr:RNA polymerase sigma factor RpoD [Candidatus Omnitrophota bacterium]